MTKIKKTAVLLLGILLFFCAAIAAAMLVPENRTAEAATVHDHDDGTWTAISGEVNSMVFWGRARNFI